MVRYEPVLAFIKAVRLKGDVNALKHTALSRFCIPLLFSAKKSLLGTLEIDKIPEIFYEATELLLPLMQLVS